MVPVSVNQRPRPGDASNTSTVEVEDGEAQESPQLCAIPDVDDLSVDEVQFREFGQPFQMHQPGVGNLSFTEVEFRKA